MRIYVAGPFTKALFCYAVASELEAAGHEIVSRWHDGPPADEVTSQRGAHVAMTQNVADLARADVLLVLGLRGACETLCELGRFPLLVPEGRIVYLAWDAKVPLTAWACATVVDATRCDSFSAIMRAACGALA